MDFIEMPQRRNQHEISSEFGKLMHTVRVIKKTHADVENIWEKKKTDRPLKLENSSKKAN